jgi:hypothetical protein
MGMSVQELRDYVRSFLDTDETELPDVLLDVWRREAEQRIQRASSSWTFFDDEWTLNTVADTASYVMADVSPVSTIDEITSITGESWRLKPLAHEAAVQRWTPLTSISAEPAFWSEYAGSIYLWPTPDDAYALSLRGKRQPLAAATAGDEPDLPDEFHELVGEYMLARAYEQQDDDIMSVQKFNRFEVELDLLRRRYERADKGGVQILGGRPKHPMSEIGARLIYDWE